MLSRYEVARLVGLRSLQLSEGAVPLVHVESEVLRCDSMYVAALELHEGLLDMQVRKSDGTVIPTRGLFPSLELRVLLDTRDGGARSYSVNASDSRKVTDAMPS